MNFKHLFFTTLFAASFGLVACDDSSSANSSNNNSNNNGKQDVISDAGQTYCNVTTTANSVTVSMALEGEATYTSTVIDGGGRYKTISSEYWYASSSDANGECEDQKEEATHWKDGSYQVTCSGNRIYISEIDEGSLREHETDFRDLCRQFETRYGSSTGKNNSSTKENNGSNAEFKCDVSRSGNSVTVLFVYKDFTTETTMSLRGTTSVVTSKATYPNESIASTECKEVKRDAEDFPLGTMSVSCSGNMVMTEMIEDGTESIESAEKSGRKYCANIQDAYESGELQRSYDDMF
ncbi:hypothetical protein [Fibrobacter sp.]|uniref:hypothetical protein n=1 Tax=Fibrobacter sp. TaxID=35828 RepID=UPI0025BC5D8F|nr:hypothetical protein [Fibrobacter sp.]MBR3072232.1 hypothetical protein [Fibrobacter sp.]